MIEIASTLVSKLLGLQCAVPSTPTLLQSECVIFQSGKAYTFSGDVFAIVDCSLDFSGAVKYKDLMDVLRKYGESEITIEALSESVLSIKRGRSQTKLPFDSQILLSIANVGSPNPDGWLKLPEKFIEAVTACESVALPGRVDDILSSINITPTCMEAASPAQIIHHLCALDINSRFLVRAGILSKLVKTNPTEYQVADKWFFLRSNSVTFAVPVYYDEFLSGIDQYLQPAEYAISFPEGLLADMPLVTTVLDKGETMQVALEGTKCVITAAGSHGVHTSEADMSIPVDLSFKIAPPLFQRILQEFPSCTISSGGIRVQNENFSYAASVE